MLAPIQKWEHLPFLSLQKLLGPPTPLVFPPHLLRQIFHPHPVAEDSVSICASADVRDLFGTQRGPHPIHERESGRFPELSVPRHTGDTPGETVQDE